MDTREYMRYQKRLDQVQTPEEAQELLDELNEDADGEDADREALAQQIVTVRDGLRRLREKRDE